MCVCVWCVSGDAMIGNSFYCESHEESRRTCDELNAKAVQVVVMSFVCEEEEVVICGGRSLSSASR
jgi:hypothetical protein